MSFLAIQSPFVGRDHELAVLHEHLAAANAGSGKTVLAETLCRDAAGQGARVFVGHSYDLTETPPYGPWINLFSRYEPGDDGPPLPEAFSQRGVLGAVKSQPILFLQ